MKLDVAALVVGLVCVAVAVLALAQHFARVTVLASRRNHHP